MADDNNIPLSISVDTKAATADIKSFEDSINHSIESIEKNFESFKLLAETVIVVLGLEKLAEGLGEVVSEAAKADQALRDLSVALAGTGEFSVEAVDHFKEFADQIEHTTTVTDDAVLKAVTLAKSFGLTNDQAEKLTSAAVDLAAATGKDLNTAVEQLGATFSGTVGRLGKTTPALKLLTEEQLRNGEAIDLLAKKYEGFAEASTQTFSGAIAQTHNAFDQILKSVGQVITQNPVIVEGIKVLGEIFTHLAEVVKDNQDSITKLISSGLKSVISILPALTQGFTFFVAVLEVAVDIFDDLVRIAVTFASVILEITKPLRDLENILGNALVGTISNVLSVIIDLADAIPGVSTTLSSLGVDIKGVQKTLEDFGDDRLDKAFSLDTSVSDSFQKFANEALDSVNEFSAKGKASVTGFLDGVGEGSVKLTDFASGLVKRFDDLSDGITGVTSGIKNLNKELDNSAAIAKRLEELKGSFDKIKGAIDPLKLEIDKLTLSQNALIDAEFERNSKNLANAAEELALQGKLKGANLELIQQYALLIDKKQQLAREKLTLGDFTIGEFVQGFSKQIDNLKSVFASFDGSKLDLTPEGLAEGAASFVSVLADGFVNAAESAAEEFSKITLGDLAEGIGDGLLATANAFGSIVGGFISGEFISQGLTVFQAFASFPQTILDIFNNAGTLFASIADALPGVIQSFLSQLPEIVKKLVASIGTIIDDLVQALPELGRTLANAVGDILEKIAEKLPAITEALINALEPLIATIFERVIPALIKALPGVIDKLAKAIPVILDIILKSLPEIISEIFKAIPQIVKSLIDAIPEIALVLADNIGPIVEAFVEGLVEAVPEIVIALVDSLLVNGGLEKIVKALILATPRIAVGLVEGLVRGLGVAALEIGHAIGNAFIAITQNLGSKLGGDFGAKVSGVFQNFIAGITSAFSFGGSITFSSITSGFTNGASTIFNSIVGAFQSVVGGIYQTIVDGFNAIFGSLYGTITGAFANIFGALASTIQNAFGNIFGGISNAIADGGNRLKDAFFAPVNRLIDFLNNFKFPDIGDIGGGGGGNIHIGGVDTGFHFASGGSVAKVPDGFNNDSFLANLQSKELVIDRDLTTKLDNFLNNPTPNQVSQPGVSDAILGKILQVLQTPQQVSTSVVINGRELANAILDLQRNNQRLSA